MRANSVLPNGAADRHPEHADPDAEALADAILDDLTAPAGDPLSAALDKVLTVTRFDGPGAATKREVATPLRALAPAILRRSALTKAALPWLKLARFGDTPTAKGSLRHDANVLTVEGVEADYDGEAVSMEEAEARLRAAGLAALLYTSPSHTPDKPRWRVLAPLSASRRPEERAALVARLNGALGGILARESFTLSQAYYYGRVGANPAHAAALVDGRFLDDAPHLDAGAIGKGHKPRAAGAAPGAAAGPAAKPARVNERELGEAITSGENYHEASTRLLGAWARKGMAHVEARARLAALFDAVPDDKRDARWRERRADLDRTLADIWGAEAVKRDREAAALDGFALTEDGIALAFAARYGDRLRYCHDTGAWFAWDGARWRVEATKLAFAWARDTCRDMVRDGLTEDRALAKAATAAAVERFAQSDRAVAVSADVWDRNPLLLGTPGGTVDLTTGALRPGLPADHITKATAVAPAPLDGFDEHLECPTWLRFLADATGGDAGLIRFLQQWSGYSLTGETKEHALLFIYGPGGNGKSVFLNTVAGIMGDYARTAAADTFTASKFDKHSTDLAMLRGARLVIASETEEGRAWAEARVKAITGGDPVTARFMRRDNFTFLPQFKLTIVGNHKPVLHNVDDAARRRFNIVPFERRPDRPDPDLESKLRAEWPAILAWAILGCLDWRAAGLVRPDAVREATADYFEAQDTFGQWLDERCEEGRAFAATAADLWASWESFASVRGERPEGRTKGFPDRLAARGFARIKDQAGIRGRGFAGVRVRVEAGEGGADDI